MKKKAIQFLIILAISAGLGVLLPNFFEYKSNIAWPGISAFAAYSIVSFVFLSMVFLVKTPKAL